MRAEEQTISWDELNKMLLSLEEATNNDDFEQVRRILRQAVSGFVPQCEISDLLWAQKRVASSK